MSESIDPASYSTLLGPSSKAAPRPQRKLLSIDGGGVRGGISIEILAEIERILQDESGSSTLVLADYFDYIGGTSVGAILAACLSLGMPVKALREYATKEVSRFFQPTHFWNRHRHKYSADGLKTCLMDLFGEMTLGSPQLKTYLLIMMRNATTDSPWPLSNNPLAKYNQHERADCNLQLPLWRLLRASAAAPTFFPPEEIPLGKNKFCFVDGAVTIANNPSYQLFLQATVPAYRLCWPTGFSKMLLVSVGTGRLPGRNMASADVLSNALGLIDCLLATASIEQDLHCRLLGKCVAGDRIDSEFGDLIDAETPWPKQFTYCRYNVELSQRAFAELQCPLDPIRLHTLDDARQFEYALEVGRAIATAKVHRAHFQGFV
jgi:hypothetical protein